MKPAIIAVFFISLLTAQTTVTVSTPTEFLKAIGSNKTIYLNEGDYDLTTVLGVGSTHVTWEDEYDGAQILISDVSNMKIIGKGNARILVSPQYTWVMKFYKCQNITLDSYTMGHTLGGYCTGGVIYMDSCKNMQVKNCKLFGSGTYGMNVYNSDNVTVEKCDVYKCTYGLLILDNSSNINFIKTRFRETGEYDLITITKCKTVNFKTCVFEKNYSSGSYLFRIDSDYDYNEFLGTSTGITINTCTFRDNRIYYFSTDYGTMIKLGDNRFERNDFTAPLPTNYTVPTIPIINDY
jgi:parallel beta-helix repeat protein